MTLDELIQTHKDTCAAALETMTRKNHDYTNNSGDPFLNFRASEILGIKAETALLIRVLDKIQRLNTFACQGKLKVAESANDSIEDIINYMILLKGLIKEKDGNK